MALEVTYGDLLDAVGDRMRLDSNRTNWSAGDLARANRAIESGLRRFYMPSQMGEHVWTFLRKEGTLALASGTAEYELATDVESFRGEPIFYSTVAPTQGPLRTVTWQVLQDSKERHGATYAGDPSIVAIAAKAFSTTDGQRWMAHFFPVPNKVFSVKYSYAFVPSMPTTPAHKIVGGQKHSETIMMLCLAAVENLINDASTHQIVNDANAMLQSSIRADLGSVGSKLLGTGVPRYSRPLGLEGRGGFPVITYHD